MSSPAAAIQSATIGGTYNAVLDSLRSPQVLGGALGLSAGLWWIGVRDMRTYAIVNSGHLIGHTAFAVLGNPRIIRF